MQWNAVLERYAKLKDPERELPSSVYLQSNEQTLTIFDGYEKAKFHFLVMPRDPFITQTNLRVPSADLVSLESLRESAHALPVLKALQSQAEEVKTMIEEEMEKSEGWKWPVNIGFHAVESMRHVHLHVISSDLISPKLKNKKHYNSFHPTLGFFLHLSDLIQEIESGGNVGVPGSKAAYEELLKLPLESFYNKTNFANIPKLKLHLEEEWNAMAHSAKQKQKHKADVPNTQGKKRTTEADSKPENSIEPKKVKI